MAEVALRRGSSLIGKTLKGGRFREQFRAGHAGLAGCANEGLQFFGVE